ncbi:MAG: hypothetical protein ACXVKI_10765 [Flavisolibacter sp.]
MSRILLALAFFLVLFSSCQKEKSLETGTPAQGSLQNDAGDCLPKKVNGAYVAGQTLNDSNYLEVSVAILKPGRFSIFTDTLNGYSFGAQGSFSTTGTQTLRLKGRGKPLTEGDNAFTVFFDSSSCQVGVHVLAAGSSGGTAVYSLDAGSGSCTGFTVSGAYTQGGPLTAANTVTLSVNVSTPGSWVVSTTSVTGFSFSGSGNFTSPGTQTIVLKGSGTPSATGLQTFMVGVGASSCSFGVTVGGGGNPPPGTGGVYFPLTSASWWSYDDGKGSDSIKTTVTGTGQFLGNTYQRLITNDATGPIDTSYYRKDNATSFYYRYMDTSDFSGLGIVFPQAGLDVLFLKDALSTGAVFTSDHPGVLGGTTPVTIRFVNTVMDANAAVTINGQNFTNVYKIELKIQAGVAGSFQDISLVPLLYYFARDIGLVRITDGTDYQDIRHWKIN